MTFRPLDILLDYAASPDADVRANAAAALGEMNEPEAQRTVVDLLGDPDRRVREAAFASHLAHPAPTGFLARFTAARRLRNHSADLVGRRAVGPSIAGIGFAVVFALAAYLLLTGLVSRMLESAVWDSLIYAAITAAIGTAFAVVAATSARPIAHYRDLPSGLAVELLWTLIVGVFPAAAMGTLVAVSIMPAQDTGAIGRSVEDEVKAAGFIWHLTFISGAILLAMLAARLAAALAARSLPAGGVRAAAAGLAAFMFGWFALWLLLLPWQAGARAGGGIDAGLVGRIGLGAFVGLGAFAATLGFLEAAGVRLRPPTGQRWIMRTGALLLSLPGLFSVTHLAMSLPTQPREIEVTDLVTTEPVSAPQMVHFNLPVDAKVMVELSPSSLDEKDRASANARNRYGKPFGDRQMIKGILAGTTSLGDVAFGAFAETDQGETFWLKEHDAAPNYSSEARRILEYWGRTAPEMMETTDLYATSSAIPFAPPITEYTEEPYPAPVDPAYPPVPAAAPDSSTPVTTPKKTWASMSQEKLAEVPAWIEGATLHRTAWNTQARLTRAEDGSYSGAVQTGRLEVCVTDSEADAGCDTNETFDSLFITLGERVVESWPLVGRPRAQAEVRLTVLTDVNAETFRLAAAASTLLLEAGQQPVEKQSSLLVALSTVSQDNNCAGALELRPGDVILRRRAPKPTAEGDRDPDSNASDVPADQSSSMWVIKQGERYSDDPDCIAPADGQVVEIALGDENSTLTHISAALKLAVMSAPGADDPVQREQLARLAAEGLSDLQKTTSPNGYFELALASLKLSAAADDIAPALICYQSPIEIVVAGSPDLLSENLLSRSADLLAANIGDYRIYLGTKWNTEWDTRLSKTLATRWKLSAEAEACGSIHLPPEVAYGPLPDNFVIEEARAALRSTPGAIDAAFKWSTSRQGQDYWSSRNDVVGPGKPLEEEDRQILEYWIRLAQAQVERRKALAGSTPDFGNDSGTYARDGECDDSRFDTGSFRDHRRADATDCRAAWESGRAEYTGD